MVTWGDPAAGGDSSEVQDKLVRGQQIQAARYIFIAILKDGFVVTWGQAYAGCESEQTQAQLEWL